MKKHHHHDHGKDASVPQKGNSRAVPSDHWEKYYDPEQPKDRPEAAFDPMLAKDRPTMYKKVNETDH